MEPNTTPQTPTQPQAPQSTNKTGLVIAFVIVVLVLFGLYRWMGQTTPSTQDNLNEANTNLNQNESEANTNTNDNPLQATLISVKVERPNIVIDGTQLGKVEVWAIPTGSGITEDKYTLLGEALLQKESNGVQTWLFTIPKEPVAATEIFAKAFDKNKVEVGRMSLSQKGASEIYDALWK